MLRARTLRAIGDARRGFGITAHPVSRLLANTCTRLGGLSRAFRLATLERPRLALDRCLLFARPDLLARHFGGAARRVRRISCSLVLPPFGAQPCVPPALEIACIEFHIANTLGRAMIRKTCFGQALLGKKLAITLVSRASIARLLVDTLPRRRRERSGSPVWSSNRTGWELGQ